MTRRAIAALALAASPALGILPTPPAPATEVSVQSGDRPAAFPAYPASTPRSTHATPGFSPAAAASSNLVVFVHDQSSDQILRMVDRNADGDAHDPGEVTVFFDDTDPVTGVDNAQGMVALDEWTLLATDNFAPDNVVLLQDLNHDGDALDAGESSVWFDGLLPSGLTITNPADLVRRTDGSFFLLDNNTLDTTRPEAIYILEDLNNDDDVNDPGEVTEFFELSPIGISSATTFDVVEDNNANVYTIDISDPNQIESIDIIDPTGTTRTEWMGSDTLYALRGWVLGSTYELEFIPERNEVLFGAYTLSSDQLILAARDNNGSGDIDLGSEIRPIWNEATHADAFTTGSPRDFARTTDGRLLWTDGLYDRVMLQIDLTGDNRYQSAGETTVFFDAATATANGLPSISLALSVAYAYTCPADVDGNGVLNLDDVNTFAIAFAAGDLIADVDANGVLNLDDVNLFALSFTAGCP
ncbi:MAG: GC-type dockerin domain-anchored protein [Phycisphaerales bacterium]